MKIDYTAAESFLECVRGEGSLDEIWKHPAYQTIRHHAQKLRGGLSQEQIEKALEGEEEVYYGISDLKDNIEDVEELMQVIQDNEDDWLEIIEDELERIVPDDDTDDITLYPVLGYDIGIGLDNHVCINLNEDIFFKDPQEFLYMAMHETSHVMYERRHGIPNIREIDSTDDMIPFFNTFFQTEGYAVYTPIRVRREEGHTGIEEHFILEDYLVISDEEKMREHVKKYDELIEDLEDADDWSLQRFMDRGFGDDRLAYRVGCTIVKEIEENMGIEEVRRAFYLDPDEFLEKYDGLLDQYR